MRKLRDPGKCVSNFDSVIYALILEIDIMSTLSEPTDDKLIWVQIMARGGGGRELFGTSHYPSQC